MEILALLPGAAALDVIHTNGDGVIGGVNHRAVAGVSEAAIHFPPRTVAPLELPAHLWRALTKTSAGILPFSSAFTRSFVVG